MVPQALAWRPSRTRRSRRAVRPPPRARPGDGRRGRPTDPRQCQRDDQRPASCDSTGWNRSFGAFERVQPCITHVVEGDAAGVEAHRGDGERGEDGRRVNGPEVARAEARGWGETVGGSRVEVSRPGVRGGGKDIGKANELQPGESATRGGEGAHDEGLRSCPASDAQHSAIASASATSAGSGSDGNPSVI